MSLFPGLSIAALALIGAIGGVLSRRQRVVLVAGVAVCAALSLGVRDVSGPTKVPHAVPRSVRFRTRLGRSPNARASQHAHVARPGATCGRWTVRGRADCSLAPARGNRRSGRVGTRRLGHPGRGSGLLGHPSVPAPPAAVRHEPAPHLHLPAGSTNDDVYSYWSTQGFPASVNGAGGFVPTRYGRLLDEVAGFPDERSVAALRSVGVRTVFVHPDRTAGTPWKALPGSRSAAFGSLARPSTACSSSGSNQPHRSRPPRRGAVGPRAHLRLRRRASPFCSGFVRAARKPAVRSHAEEAPRPPPGIRRSENPTSLLRHSSLILVRTLSGAVAMTALRSATLVSTLPLVAGLGMAVTTAWLVARKLAPPTVTGLGARRVPPRLRRDRCSHAPHLGHQQRPGWTVLAGLAVVLVAAWLGLGLGTLRLGVRFAKASTGHAARSATRFSACSELLSPPDSPTRRHSQSSRHPTTGMR